MARESQLEKDIQEGNQVSSFEKLVDSATAILTGLQREKEEILKRESKLTRSCSSSDEEIEEIPPTSERSPKRRKVDVDLIEKCKRYLFRTQRWGCVTIIKKRKAITFAHGDCTLQPGMSIKIYSIGRNIEFIVKVAKKNIKSDWILLESNVDLCEKMPIWEPVVDGRRYVQLGLSVSHQKESPFAISTGVVTSGCLNSLGHTLGSSRANPGDSGGGCFSESSGCLIGINVGCENIPISTEKNTGAHIIPIASFQFV